MKHNLKTISFMIASFKDIVGTFGMNEKSISFFKKNIEGLSAISQVTSSDANLIYDILDINDKNISYEQRMKSLNKYVMAINRVHTVKNKETIFYIINDLRNSNVISEKTKRNVLETLDIDEALYKENVINTIKAIKENNDFGSYSFNEKSDINISEIEKYKEIIKGNKNLHIKIKNENAVCYGDRHYYIYKLKDFLDTLTDKYEGDNALKALKYGDFIIGQEESSPSGDPCRGFITTFREDTKIKAEFLKINWNKVVAELTINKDKQTDDLDYDY